MQIGNHSFTFDHVFGSTGEGTVPPLPAIFDRCVAPLVDGLFHGYNATVLAYGQACVPNILLAQCRRNIIAVDCEKIFLSIVPSSSRSLQTLLQLVHDKNLRSTPPCCLCSFRFGHQMTRLVLRWWAADRIREDIHDGNRLQSRGKLRRSHP